MFWMIESYFVRQPIVGRIFIRARPRRRGGPRNRGNRGRKDRWPLLLISGTDDQMWSSTRLSEMVIERLKAHDHPFPYQHLCSRERGT